MQISGKLTDKEIQDIARSQRSKWYWLRLFSKNLYGCLLVGAALYAVIAGDKQHRQGRFLLGFVIAATFSWAYWHTRRHATRELAAARAGMADCLTVNDLGLHLKFSNGAIAATPWSAFSSWSQIGTVIRINLADSTNLALLPLAKLSTAEREMLRGIVGSHLGPER